uniref:taste receptor type 2 member 40 n=1 Tax=Lonchura striata TaxID=40157 RepID=UPI00129367C7|nr:taste receptor type 2 member 40 [Lonchura striata domestica]
MTPFAVLCLSIAVVESLAGILGNGIILAASSSTCIGSKTWSQYDMIMSSLSSSRLILQLWATLDFLISIFYEPIFYKGNMYIVSETIHFFIWLKLRIARLVPWMLLTSWLCSFTAALPFAWDVYSVHENITALLPMTNCSARRTTWNDSLGLLILLCNASIGLPLMLSVVSNILLIRSLWIHTRHMQNNASGFGDPSLEAHMKAIKSVFSFLILYIIFFICVLIIVFNAFLPLSNGDSIFVVLMAACPTAHTFVLIWSNPKFQELPARIWQHIKCHVITASM